MNARSRLVTNQFRYQENVARFVQEKRQVSLSFYHNLKSITLWCSNWCAMHIYHSSTFRSAPLHWISSYHAHCTGLLFQSPWSLVIACPMLALSSSSSVINISRITKDWRGHSNAMRINAWILNSLICFFITGDIRRASDHPKIRFLLVNLLSNDYYKRTLKLDESRTIAKHSNGYNISIKKRNKIENKS